MNKEIEFEGTSDRRRVLGIDLGKNKIGLAMSDAARILASPYGVIVHNDSAISVIDEILRIAETEEVKTIVVGLPTSLSEKNTIASENAQLFVDALKSKSSIPILTEDERFTTVLATRKLRESGHNSRSMKSKIDSMAASEILQSYLDSHVQ